MGIISSVLKELCRHSSGRVKTVSQLLLSFVVSSGVWKSCLIPPFRFNFYMKDVLQDTSFDLADVGISFSQGIEF